METLAVFALTFSVGLASPAFSTSGYTTGFGGSGRGGFMGYGLLQRFNLGYGSSLGYSGGYGPGGMIPYSPLLGFAPGYRGIGAVGYYPFGLGSGYRGLYGGLIRYSSYNSDHMVLRP